jgi:hypothetical protein
VVLVSVLLGLIGNLATATVDIPMALRPWIWGVTALLIVTVVVLEACHIRAATACLRTISPPHVP